MKIWSVSDIDDTASYQLLLCQNALGRRYFKLLRADEQEAALMPEEHILLTQVVPNQLLKARDLHAISLAVSLSNGERFCVDAHGVWLTTQELNGLNAGAAYGAINWVTAAPPFFPDR